jgi:hypothetical protein
MRGLSTAAKISLVTSLFVGLGLALFSLSQVTQTYVSGGRVKTLQTFWYLWAPGLSLATAGVIYLIWALEPEENRGKVVPHVALFAAVFALGFWTLKLRVGVRAIFSQGTLDEAIFWVYFGFISPIGDEPLTSLQLPIVGYLGLFSLMFISTRLALLLLSPSHSSSKKIGAL